MLTKSIVMIVNEVKCIFMYLNLMTVWLFKHCCTDGEQGWKSHGEKALCVVLIDRRDSYRGQSMEGDSGIFGMCNKCLISSTSVLALVCVQINDGFQFIGFK